MTDCVEIHTDVNYHTEHDKPQENHCTKKFVFHNYFLIYSVCFGGF
jgi:hypothetical protein